MIKSLLMLWHGCLGVKIQGRAGGRVEAGRSRSRRIIVSRGCRSASVILKDRPDVVASTLAVSPLKKRAERMLAWIGGKVMVSPPEART
jgi:hypothetical protein